MKIKVTPHFPDGELQKHSIHIQANNVSLVQLILILSSHVHIAKVLFPCMFSDQHYLFVYLHTRARVRTDTKAFILSPGYS